MGLTRAKLMKLDMGKKVRAQTLFRLWSDDRRKLLKKLIDDNLSMQVVMETLCLGYLRNDPNIMACLKEFAPTGLRKRHKRVHLGFDKDDAATILAKLENESPLQDKEIARK